MSLGINPLYHPPEVKLKGMYVERIPSMYGEESSREDTSIEAFPSGRRYAYALYWRAALSLKFTVASITGYNPEYVNKNEGAYFWSRDEVVVSDSLSNGIVRNLSIYHPGIRRMTTRLITSPTKVRPSYSVRLVKVED